MTIKDKLLPKEQHKQFVETARALGCDEDKERFEKALGKIARHKPPKDDTQKKRPRIKASKNDR